MDLKSGLESYGFYDFQIEKLLKKKRLSCSHGIYVIKGSQLYLNGNMQCDLLKVEQ